MGSVIGMPSAGGLGGVEGLRQALVAPAEVTQLLHHREAHELPTIVTARLGDCREVRRIHKSLVSRIDVPLKVELSSQRTRVAAVAGA